MRQFVIIKNYFNKHYFDFLWAMTEKELKARYKNTVFGFLWVLINPLLQMMVIGFVFRFFAKEPIDNYFLYLFVGLLIWNFFSMTINKTTSSIVNERSLIKKAKFPREAIPISIIISNFINMLIAFILLVPVVIYKDTLTFAGLPGLLLGVVLLLSFTVGFSLITSSLNVRYRDISFFVQAVLILWFYVTPIIYSITFIPYELIWIWRLNPLTSVAQLFQHSLASAVPPGYGMLGANIAITIVTVWVGINVFKRNSSDFDDWL